MSDRLAEAAEAEEHIRLVLFRNELRSHIAADWQLGPGIIVWLYDAWKLLPFDVLAEVAEQACRDFTGGYFLPKDENRRYVVRYNYVDRDRRTREAARDALYAGDLIAEGFAPNAAPHAPRTRVARERWGAIDVDWEACQAGLITGITVTRGTEIAGKDIERTRPVSDRRIREWVKQRVDELKDAEETCSMRGIWKMAQADSDLVGARRQAVHTAYKREAPEEWQRRGRRRKN